MDSGSLYSFSIKKYLPSKKILIAIGVIGVAALAYWGVPRLVNYYQTHRAVFMLGNKPPEPLIASPAGPASFDRDTDGDGISDWRENLFGLDPNKTDTDGDGTRDTLPTVGGTSVGDLVQLSDLGKLTVSVYSAFQDTPSTEISEEQVSDQIGNQVLTHAQETEASLKAYSAVDLILVDTDQNTIIAYESAVKKMIDDVPDGELLIKNLQETILQGKAPGQEAALINQKVTQMLAMSVPSRMSDLHLAMLNATYYISQILQLPPSADELTIYTRSIIVQKNINLVIQTVGDISTVANAYRASF